MIPIELMKKESFISSFLHFDFDEPQIKLFSDMSLEVSLGFDHENYHHISILSSSTKTSLVEDFDS